MDEFAEFLEAFQRETDRAAAALGAAYLDSRLELLLRSKFVAVPKFVDDLLAGQGGLSSFSARISSAYAVGLISRRAADDLHSIRRIRNDFAHRPTAFRSRLRKLQVASPTSIFFGHFGTNLVR
jgi:hypothetical protein